MLGVSVNAISAGGTTKRGKMPSGQTEYGNIIQSMEIIEIAEASIRQKDMYYERSRSLLGLFCPHRDNYLHISKQLLRTLLREVEYSVCMYWPFAEDSDTVRRQIRGKRKERGGRRGSISVRFRDMLRRLDKRDAVV